MAYNATTKRIYVDTSTNPDTGVSIGDLQQCFNTTIQGTINGQTVRRLSSDLGVICALRTGDYFDEGGVRWTVTSRAEINLWARYKPIPCRANNPNNVPIPITTAQRIAENHGVDTEYDMYISSDYVQSFENYADTLDLTQPYTGVKMRTFDRPFGNQYIRLTDFAKVNDSRLAVHNVGYDHNARPDNITLHHGTKSYQLTPLIPEDARTIYIPAGSRRAIYEFPYDALWLRYYFMTDTEKYANNVTIDCNEEWLSPLDFVSGNTYSSVVRANTVRRGAAIYLWGPRTGRATGWRCIGRVWDRTTSNNPNDAFHRDFSTTPAAFLDLTDTSNTTVSDLETGQSLRTLNGEYLVVEFWRSMYDNGSRDNMPIPGYAYKINIIRGQLAPDDIDIEGVVEFLTVSTDNGTGNSINLHFRVVTTQLNNYSSVLNLLKAKYTVLNSSVNVNSSSLNVDYNIRNFADGAFNLERTADGFTYYYVPIGQAKTEYTPETEPNWVATITAQQSTESSSHAKTFTIDRSSIE